MNQYQLRQATVSDLPEMHRVISAAMTQYAKDSSIPTVLEALRETAEDLREYVLHDYFLLAFRGEKLVGTLRISQLDEKSAFPPPGLADSACRTAYISRFAVLSSMQKLGVGNALFAGAEEYIRNNGYHLAVLHTALTNLPLVRFYTKRKFELASTATDRGYPRGTFIKHYV